MRRFLLLMVCVLGLFGSLCAQSTTEDLTIIEVGADKNPDKTLNVPVYDYAYYSMSQQIYTAEDLGGNVGAIYSVAFKVGNDTYTQTREYEVYLTSTELDAFDGGNFIALSENDKYFDGDVEISATADTWFTINLDRPFNYFGGNFVLTVYDKTGLRAGYHYFYKYAAEGRALTSNQNYEFDMFNLTTGSSRSYVNQIQIGIANNPGLEISKENIAFGEVKTGGYWSEKVQTASFTVQAVSTTITSISCDNDFFTLNYDINATPVNVEVSYDATAEASGEQTGNITIKANGAESVVTVSAIAYLPASTDVYELAQEITFEENAYTHTPEFANLKDDYNLPKEVKKGSTPDAVYSFELNTEATIAVNVTGTNAIAAIYSEDFGGKGGPMANNNNKGNIPSAGSSFDFNFNEGGLADFTLIDADGDGYNWHLLSDAIGNDTYGIASYSYVYTNENGGSYKDVTPDNYIHTKEAYAITASSKMSFDIKSNGFDDKYAVVVSRDGNTFEEIYVETYRYQVVKTVELDLSSYAGEVLYIGFRHYDCTGQYALFIDNFQLTYGNTAKRGEEPQIQVSYPAGRYYLVAAAEDAFTVTVTLEVAPPAVPTNLTATTINETSIALAWDAVEGVESYNIYQDEEFLTSVEGDATSYTVENLEANTSYCFIVSSVNHGIESLKTEVACAKTNDYVIAAPANVVVEGVDAYSVKLTWDAVENAQSYNVYAEGEFVANVTETVYVLENLEPATEYCLEVSAVRNDQDTEKVEACGSTTEAPEEPVTLAAPTNLRATIRQDVPGFNYKYEITMAWDAVEGATGYDVFVNTATEQDFHMGYTNGTAYVAGANVEGTLEFYVVAFNDETESEPSEPYTITIVDDAVEEMTASFNVYPNPVNDRLYIETETEVKEVVVYDVYGRQQTTVNGQQTSSIDISNLNSGVYFIKVVTENGEVVKRIIKN